MLNFRLTDCSCNRLVVEEHWRRRHLLKLFGKGGNLNRCLSMAVLSPGSCSLILVIADGNCFITILIIHFHSFDKHISNKLLVKIGRQTRTNAPTVFTSIPTVPSKQHAEVWEEGFKVCLGDRLLELYNKYIIS